MFEPYFSISATYLSKCERNNRTRVGTKMANYQQTLVWSFCHTEVEQQSAVKTAHSWSKPASIACSAVHFFSTCHKATQCSRDVALNCFQRCHFTRLSLLKILSQMIATIMKGCKLCRSTLNKVTYFRRKQTFLSPSAKTT